METRREVLARAALGLGVVACGRALGQPAERAAYVAVETSAATGRSRARFLGADGAPAGTVPLDFRAHGMARHGDLMAVFPRRPGTRFALVDLRTLEVRAVAAAPEGRRFHGHGAFGAGGRTLLVTENDLTTLGGAVGIYELPGLRRLGALPLPRPGPHDIRHVPGTDRFHVALGGLETHPDYGRTPLNLGAFASEIVTLDLGVGDPARPEAMGLWPGTEGVSLRHLADDGRGRLHVGGQRADPARPGAGDVLWVVEDGRARSLPAGELLGGYVSSVAGGGGRAVVTSKDAGRALILANGEVVAERRIDGASAAAMCGAGPVVSGYAMLGIGGAAVPAAEGQEFDNHGLALA